MKISYCSITDKGVTREHNEDFFLNSPKYSLFMVADGMGGYQSGDFASRYGLESILHYLDTSTPANGIFSDRAFKFAVEYANTRINTYKKNHPEISNMGTTFIALAFGETQAMLYNIGDSRLYRLRKGTLNQISKDHSAEKELLPEFMQNAKDGKFSSVITRALGATEQVQCDASPAEPQIDDYYLLCSDGLYSMVPDIVLQQLLERPLPLKDKVQALIDEANRLGGEDNITATVLHIESMENPSVIESIEASV